MTYELTVHPFEMGTDKEAAVKVLEEAAESFAEWQEYKSYAPTKECIALGYPECNCEYQCETYTNPRSHEIRRKCLSDELADVIQAACNLADRYGIDLQAAMERCERRNRDRGRYE